MTEIEKKALALLNGFHSPCEYAPEDHPVTVLCRAIEAHEAFRQEVSDAVLRVRAVWDPVRWPGSFAANHLDCFIIAKPDPLTEALKAIGGDDEDYCDYNAYAHELRAALAARGLEIREIEK